jgi:hypothetical protein
MPNLLKTSLDPPCDKPFKCEQCDKPFRYEKNLKRHATEGYCKPNIGIAGDQNVVNASIEGDRSIIGNQNTVDNSVTNNYITVNMFGYENTDEIEKDFPFLQQCSKDARTTGIPNLLERIYLKTPENVSVRHKRSTSPAEVYVLRETGWEVYSLNEAIFEMVQKGVKTLVVHNEKFYKLQEMDDDEDFDHEAGIPSHRTKKEFLNRVVSKKRGVYAPIKQGVAQKLKAAK